MGGCRWTVPIVVCLIAATPCAGEGQPDNETLRREISALQAEIDAIRAARGDENWLTQQRAEEIRGLVHDVLADADTRTSLLQDGVTAGYDRFFYIASPDGSFRLNFLGMVQARFVFNSQDDEAPDDSTRWGFENSRTRFGVLGPRASELAHRRRIPRSRAKVFAASE